MSWKLFQSCDSPRDVNVNHVNLRKGHITIYKCETMFYVQTTISTIYIHTVPRNLYYSLSFNNGIFVDSCYIKW